jgi:hypothetical protein
VSGRETLERQALETGDTVDAFGALGTFVLRAIGFDTARLWVGRSAAVSTDVGRHVIVAVGVGNPAEVGAGDGTKAAKMRRANAENSLGCVRDEAGQR